MEELGADELTLPVELNEKELAAAGCAGKELIVYGRLPVMVSAQCVRRTVSGCDRKPGLLWLKDRMGKEFPVRNCCRFCCNTIYNADPLSLLGMGKAGEAAWPRQAAPAVYGGGAGDGPSKRRRPLGRVSSPGGRRPSPGPLPGGILSGE